MVRDLGAISLKNYNTFGIDIQADRVLEVTDQKDLLQIKDLSSSLILGGGSNVLFTDHIKNTVILNRLKGIELYPIEDGVVEASVASGENWHEFVLFCVNNGLGGIENLSLIPGSVGAAPMQNIGAYGVEVKDVITKVEAIERQTGKLHSFSNEDCEFGYRESVFKRRLKGKFFITRVYFKLSSENHRINTSYGAISQVLEKQEISEPSIKDVSNAVIQIRSSKLPDPKEIGNAGSFFKNPVISTSHFNKLKNQYPDIKSYPINEMEVKVPAGWLIESCGWKGKRVGNTGSHKNQALVLVNHGGAQGEEVRKLSEQIVQSVREKYQINLETEVNII